MYTFLDAYSSVQSADSSVVSGVIQRPIINIGSVLSAIPVASSIVGTVPVTQSGTRITSVVGGYAEDSPHTTGDTGILGLGVRNDTISSFAGTNLDYAPIGIDSAGRSLVKPFAPEEAVVRGRASLVSAGAAGSALAISAPGAGLRIYVTDVLVTNTGAATVRLDISDSDGSVIGTTIAPAGGGSNVTGLATPMTTIVANKAVGAVASGASSLVTVYLYGYKAP